MRKLGLLTIIVFTTLFSFSQTPSVVDRSSPVITVRDWRWMSGYNLFIPRYLDTTAANLQKGIDSAGAIIYTYDNVMWIRYSSPKKWVQVGAYLAGNFWNILGNAGTVDGTNFIGTTDNIPFNIRVNNQKSGRIESSLSTANTFYGYQSGIINTGLYNTTDGYKTLFSNTTGSGNTAMGFHSLAQNTTGTFNTGIGCLTLHDAAATTGNTAVGALAVQVTTIGNYNTGVGYEALYNNTTGNNNIAVGDSALYTNITGYNNTAIGTKANVGSNNLHNATAIGANAIVGQSNSMSLMDTTAPIGVGIGTSYPTNTLHVKASSDPLRLQGVGIGSSSDSVLNIDDNGIVHKIAVSDIAQPSWLLTGNAGTDESINFIGTTDFHPLIFKVNNAISGHLDPNNLNTSFGAYSFQSLIGNSNTAIGAQALSNNNGGIENTAVGASSMLNNVVGNDNTAFGINSLSNNTVDNNTAIGAYSLTLNSSGTNNTALGLSSLQFNVEGYNNTAIGAATMVTNLSGHDLTVIGSHANVTDDGLTNATAIGANAWVGCSYCMSHGDSLLTKNGFGTAFPDHTVTVHGDFALVDGSQGIGKVLTSDANGVATWQTLPSPSNDWTLLGNAGTVDGTNFIGTTDSVPFNIRVNNQKAGRVDVNPTKANTFYGYKTGNVNTGTFNTANGYQALYTNSTGYYNTAIGAVSLNANTTGYENTASGLNSLHGNIDGYDNTAIGVNSLYLNISGIGSSALGFRALQNSTGNYNTAIGVNSLSVNTTGTNNSAIGSNADVISNNLTNATAIGANAKVGKSNAISLGDSTLSTKTGIGTSFPDSTLTVRGGLKFINGTQGANKILTSDANGGATWQTAPATGWSLTGNAGTVDGTNFIGTTDNVPFNIKVNNQKAGRIDVTTISTFYGYQSGNATVTGAANTGYGNSSLFSVTSGFYNTAIGANSLYTSSNGIYNNAVGISSLYSNTSGSYNTSNGGLALYSNTTGSNNTALGYHSLFSNTTGSSNTAIGYQADVGSAALSNATSIGANTIVNVSNTIALGDSAAASGAGTKVGIGTGAATERLDVRGNLRFSGALMPNNTAGTSGQVLTSAGSGTVPTWQTPAGQKLGKNDTLFTENRSASGNNVYGFSLTNLSTLDLAVNNGSASSSRLFADDTETSLLSPDGSSFFTANSSNDLLAYSSTANLIFKGSDPHFQIMDDNSDNSYIDYVNGGNAIQTQIVTESDGDNWYIHSNKYSHHPLFLDMENKLTGIETITPSSTLTVNGSFSAGYVAKTADYTATSLDYTIECTANTFQITLPTAVGITGRMYNIANSGSGTITIGTTLSQPFANVSGTPTTITMITKGNTKVQSNGSAWLVL